MYNSLKVNEYLVKAKACESTRGCRWSEGGGWWESDTEHRPQLRHGREEDLARQPVAALGARVVFGA